MHASRSSVRAALPIRASSPNQSIRSRSVCLGLLMLLVLASSMAAQTVSAGVGGGTAVIRVVFVSCQSDAFPAVKATFGARSCLRAGVAVNARPFTGTLLDANGDILRLPVPVSLSILSFTFTEVSPGAYTLVLSTDGQDVSVPVSIGSGTGTVTFTYTQYLPFENTAPEIAGGSPVVVTTPEDTAFPVSIPATDGEGDAVTFMPSTPPAHGTVSSSGRILTYRPDPDYAGPDSFSYRLADEFGAASTVQFDVTGTSVNDRPAIEERDDVTVPAIGPNGATVSFDPPAATDVEDGALTAVCAPASGSRFAVGTTTVTCTATDGDGATAASDFTVTVTDTTPPVLTVPTDFVVEATSAGGAIVSFTATATDLVDGIVPVSCTPTSGTTFSIGITTVRCTATDSRNNTASGSFTITVRDTTGPAIAWIGGPQPTRSYTRSTLPGEPTCTATDAASTVTQCWVYGYSTAVGTHTLTARARDSVGNASVSTRTYTVTGGSGGGTIPSATPVPSRPTAPPASPTQPPLPTAAPTRTPRPTTPPTATSTPVPTVAPTTAPIRPPRR